MVMEAATLSGPQRKCNVVPVQKSLSLPSYARVGGEGIDHRLIFAALEQKEKIRRKSKIFTKEKTARQNIFCLPISTGSKCKETSLSSDTSCSSLEYQKPKPTPKLKKKETKLNENDQPPNEQKAVKTNTHESKSNLECSLKSKLSQNVINGHSDQIHSYFKDSRSPVDTFRLNVGSSDSMERSSRSSNDSLTRKERLVAIKARVEAEREKYRSSSSEEESSNITRYNSDGVIHRTVKEVKTRSYRHERRLRRRSQGEWAVKKTDRKNNLSLCLNPEDDGIKLHLDKLDRLNNEINNLEVKTDYCPSPNFPENTKKNYFSDFPSRENVTKFVQQRIRHIEEEERKRRSGSDFFDKIKFPWQNSSLMLDKPLYASTEHVNKFEKKPETNNYISDIRSSNAEFLRRASPIPKTTQAPTPPPRSPKSITFVNKAFLQHQNAALKSQENSLERKTIFHPTVVPILPTRQLDKINTSLEVLTRDSKSPFSLQDTLTDKQQMRELFNARRKTCGNFDFIDEKALNDLCTSIGTAGSSNLSNYSQSSTSLTQIKNADAKSSAVNIEDTLLSVVNKGKGGVNKWEESERRREFMFNSLENKRNYNMLPWVKKKISPLNTDSCICCLPAESGVPCVCKDSEKLYKNKNIENDTIQSSNFETTKEKKFYSDPIRERLPIYNGNSVKCSCYPALKDKMMCKCKLHKDKFQSDNLSILSNEFKNSPKHVHTNKLNGNHELLNKNISRLQIDKSSEKTSGQNFNCLNNKPVSCNSKFSSNNDSANSMNNASATANLDSAMAELESVYLSLKFSSDNLSDRNSLSNMSFSDEDSKVFNKNSKDSYINKDLQLKRSSIHETNSYFDARNIPDTKKNANKACNDYQNSSNIRAVKDISMSSKDILSRELSINDLFKDLTPHLNALDKDIESCRNRQPQSVNQYQINKLEKQPNANTSPISFKKEFYENLQKQQQQGNLQRKKQKAVRSLSENISQLMNSSKSNNSMSPSHSPVNSPTINLSKSTSNSSTVSNRSMLDESRKSPHKHNEPSSNSPRLLMQANHLDRIRCPKQEEIRQIRVSMDSTSPSAAPSATTSYPETSQYPRLSTAVYSPQMSPKCELPKPFQFNSSNSSKETINKTIDGLEELLNSLLVDVPEANQPSLSKKKDSVPASSSAPMSTGEMRVLQHLDVIRLKPVPS